MEVSSETNKLYNFTPVYKFFMISFFALLSGFSYCSINPTLLEHLSRLYENDKPTRYKSASQYFAPMLTCVDPVYMSNKLCQLSPRKQCLEVLRLFYEPQGVLDGFVCDFQQESKLRQDMTENFPYLKEIEASTADIDLITFWKFHQIRQNKIMLKNNLKVLDGAVWTIRYFKMQMLLYHKLYSKLSYMKPNAVALEVMNLQR